MTHFFNIRKDLVAMLSLVDHVGISMHFIDLYHTLLSSSILEKQILTMENNFLEVRFRVLFVIVFYYFVKFLSFSLNEKNVFFCTNKFLSLFLMLVVTQQTNQPNK